MGEKKNKYWKRTPRKEVRVNINENPEAFFIKLWTQFGLGWTAGRGEGGEDRVLGWLKRAVTGQGHQDNGDRTGSSRQR